MNLLIFTSIVHGYFILTLGQKIDFLTVRCKGNRYGIPDDQAPGQKRPNPTPSTARGTRGPPPTRQRGWCSCPRTRRRTPTRRWPSCEPTRRSPGGRGCCPRLLCRPRRCRPSWTCRSWGTRRSWWRPVGRGGTFSRGLLGSQGAGSSASTSVSKNWTNEVGKHK